MNHIKIILDIKQGSWTLDQSNFHGGSYAEIHMCFEMYNYPVPADFKFGFTLTRSSTLLLSKSYPEISAKFEIVDSFPVAVEREWFAAEYEHTLHVWKIADGLKIEDSFTFLAPRPPKPYPSWLWENGFWMPPVKKPVNGPYEWKEDSQTWIPLFAPDSIYARMPQYGNEGVDPETGKVVKGINDENHKPSPLGPTNQVEYTPR